jgi:hypothetical protein
MASGLSYSVGADRFDVALTFSLARLLGDVHPCERSTRSIGGIACLCLSRCGPCVPQDMAQAFPADWPQGCPPAAATAATGTIFRVVHNPFAPRDFRSPAEKGTLPTADPCMRVGLSVLPTEQDALHTANLFPPLGDHIAAADLAADHGKLMRTPTRTQQQHMTWWPSLGLDRASLFRIVQHV